MICKIKSIFLPLILVVCFANCSDRLAQTSIHTTYYDQIITQMDTLVTNYPQKIYKFSLGKNDAGDTIWGYRISSTPSVEDSNKRAFLLVAAHHGDEWGTANVSHDFSSYYLQKMSLDDSHWTLLQEIYVIPVLNIPGFNQRVRTEKNIDPNRDYPGPCVTDQSSTFRLKSTKALADLLSSRTFVGTVTLHGYHARGALTYPWGVTSSLTETADNDYYSQLVSSVAQENGYPYGNSTSIIYSANGTFEDYTYWTYGQWSILFEIIDNGEEDRSKNVKAIYRYISLLTEASSSTDHSFTGTCSTRGIVPRFE